MRHVNFINLCQVPLSASKRPHDNTFSASKFVTLALSNPRVRPEEMQPVKVFNLRGQSAVTHRTAIGQRWADLWRRKLADDVAHTG